MRSNSRDWGWGKRRRFNTWEEDRVGDLGWAGFQWFKAFGPERFLLIWPKIGQPFASHLISFVVFFISFYLIIFHFVIL